MIMTPTLKMTLIGVGSAVAGAGVATIVTHRILTKRANEITSGIHAYYREALADHQDTVKRLHAIEEAVNTAIPSIMRDSVINYANRVLEAGNPSEDGEEVVVDDKDSKNVVVTEGSEKALEWLLSRSNVKGTPYHLIGKNAADANVEPSRGTVESNITPGEDTDEEELSLEEQLEYVDNPGDPEISAEKHDRPFIISRDELGDSSWHDVECLIYYDGDGTLTDECDNALNIEDTIGEENLYHFVDGLLYIRNDKLGMDYEVRWQDNSFSEVMGLLNDVGPTREKIRRRNGLQYDD